MLFKCHMSYCWMFYVSDQRRSSQYTILWLCWLCMTCAKTKYAVQINAKTMDKRKLTTLFEVTGSTLAVVYALLIASNTGSEILGFSLLLISSGLFAAWAVIDKRWAFLTLQFFYAASAIIGLIRWA